MVSAHRNRRVFLSCRFVDAAPSPPQPSPYSKQLRPYQPKLRHLILPAISLSASLSARGGHKHSRDSAHNYRAPSETLVVKELFPNGPPKTSSSSWNIAYETPNGPLKMRPSSSWNTRYDNPTKRRKRKRTESDPIDTNQKWLRGQSPPTLYNQQNETPAWVINHNRRAKYIAKDYQTKTRRYSHSYRSGAAFYGTEEENTRPIDQYSPTKFTNRTELVTAGRQLVSHGPRTSLPLMRDYYHSGRINDKANASATRFKVPNTLTNDNSTGIVASRDLEAQNIPSSAISKDKPTGFAFHRGRQLQDLPRQLEMNRNMNNRDSPSRKRNREMDDNFQTPAIPAKRPTPITRSLLAVAQNSPHGRALQKARDSDPNSIQKKDTVSSSYKYTSPIAPLAMPERRSMAIDLTPSNGLRSARIQPAQTFAHSATVYINQIYENLAIDIRHHGEEMARWERESLAKGFDQAKAEHWLLVMDIQLLIGRFVALCKTHPVVEVVEPSLVQMSCELRPCFDKLWERSNVFIDMDEEEADKVHGTER